MSLMVLKRMGELSVPVVLDLRLNLKLYRMCWLLSTSVVPKHFIFLAVAML